MRIVTVLAGAGFLVSLNFVYLQAFVLEAFCLYCLISALFSTLLFIGSIWLTIEKWKGKPLNQLSRGRFALKVISAAQLAKGKVVVAT